MSVRKLESATEQCLHSLSKERADALIWVERARAELASTAGVYVLEGGNMKTVAGLLDEFASALRFPDYFGHNFNALKDCLTDLSWTGTTGHVLVILDACDVLKGETADDLRAFFGIVTVVCQEWRNPIKGQAGWDRPPRPFHVVFQATPKEWESCGTRFARAEAGIIPFPP